MPDIESRLREMDLRPPRDLQARALAAASKDRGRRARLLGVVLGLVAAFLAAYAGLAIVNAPAARASAASGYGVGEGCWLVRDAAGLHFHIGGWYHGLPALCTSESRDPALGGS